MLERYRNFVLRHHHPLISHGVEGRGVEDAMIPRLLLHLSSQ